jgi:glucose/arabinose dehydrogenase
MTKKTRSWIIAIVVTVIVVGGALALQPIIKRKLSKSEPSTLTPGEIATPAVPVEPVVSEVPESAPRTEVLAQDLTIPWEIVFLPDGDMLVTERPGQVLRIGDDRRAIPLEGVEHTGEGGLLGMTLHPDFGSNNQLYLYYTTNKTGTLTNVVDRYTLKGNSLTNRTQILGDIPASSVHDGGRLAFGPDGFLYVTTGDAADPENSQDKTSLAGKILRVDEEGKPAPDNPFDNAVYSYGHRNVQGITWDADGRLWATEHGPSGACPACAQDELNLIEPGKNYGWPTITGDQTAAGLESPAKHSTTNEVWAPSGAVFYNSSVFFTGLKGEALYQAKLDGTKVTEVIPHFRITPKDGYQGEFGRIRAVKIGPDGFFYILTQNTDGRLGSKPNDDKLIRVNPNIFR